MVAIYTNRTAPTTIRNAFLTLATGTTTVRLASPFFSYSQVVEELAAAGCCVYLIVRLGPATPPDELGRIFTLPRIQVRFFTSPLFHTKLYIFGDTCALVGSANLTQAGMLSNREAAVTVPAEESDFEALVGLFEAYWSEAEVLDAQRLGRYRHIWASRPSVPSDREFEESVKQAFGESVPSEGIQVGRPRQAASMLYLEDYRRTYQTFLSAFREIEALYLQTGQRKEPVVPLRIEIDQFFNYIRETHCRGDDYLTVPILPEPERRERTGEFIRAWLDCNWPYLHEDMVKAYQTINARFGDPAAIRQASFEEILEAMEVCHAFKEELRFNLGGLPTLRSEFVQRNEIDHVRRSLEYLFHGQENFVDRMGALVFDPALHIARCGRNVVQELLGWVNRDNVPICNGRTLKAIRFLGYDVRA